MYKSGSGAKNLYLKNCIYTVGNSLGLFMSTRRELEALKRRLNKIVPIIQTPELKLHVIGASDTVPIDSKWEMVIRVEEKHPSFNR